MDENQKLVAANEKMSEETRKATKENAEACAALIKLDEARVVMNKLLGPQGPLQMAERHKYLSVQNDQEYTYD